MSEVNSEDTEFVLKFIVFYVIFYILKKVISAVISKTTLFSKVMHVKFNHLEN
jgi:hypothetical protein